MGEPNVIEEREDETFHPGLDRETEEESQGNLASSSEDLSDGQLEDMVEDLHNLLFLHGPQQQLQDAGEAGREVEQESLEDEGAAGRVEEQERVEAGDTVEDDLPQEYRYLRNLHYNQPRQPKKGDIVKYFDFNYDGWLRVRVTSTHKKSSKYAGSVNCVFLDIDREPDGLYFYSGDFWSIINTMEDDPEPSQEGEGAPPIEEERTKDVKCSSSKLSSPAEMERVSNRSMYSLNPAFSGAGSGVPPVVPVQGLLQPNVVYTIPPPPPAVFYSSEVIQRARNLSLHPSQEYMRYEIAQSLTHKDRKDSKNSKSKGVFAKLRQLGSNK